MLVDPQDVVGRPTEIERVLVLVFVHDPRGSSAAPEARVLHLQELTELVSAEMVERRCWVRHPFYNASAGAPLRVGQFVDDALD
jgi:hypothetical protein